MHHTRPSFTTDALLSLIRQRFDAYLASSIPGDGRRPQLSTTDCLMSALAMFGLKYPSLLQFDKEARAEQTILRHNLAKLYGVQNVPCDTRMRERLDGLDVAIVRAAMKALIAQLQRGKVLEQWKVLQGATLISLDGTGFFSSSQVHCDHCCEKHHRHGTTTYHHQMVVGSIVCPSVRQVLPIGFEPIIKEDGAKKNDCERNAVKRWLTHFRQDHPQLPTIIVADGLSANDPFIEALEKHRCQYILVCKRDDHKFLWDWFDAAQSPERQEITSTENKIQKRYRYMKNVPLNGKSPRCVTVIHYEEKHPSGKILTWGWVTDVHVTPTTVRAIVNSGRVRWKIENETFNTLKNQGYHFEHNYGHGYKTLSNVLAGLMLLAFLVDQCLEAVHVGFKKAMVHMGQRCRFWEKQRLYVTGFLVETWEDIYGAIVTPPRISLALAREHSP